MSAPTLKWLAGRSDTSAMTTHEIEVSADLAALLPRTSWPFTDAILERMLDDMADLAG